MGKLANRLRSAKQRGDRPMGFETGEAKPHLRRGLLIAVAAGEVHGADALIRAADLSDAAALTQLASGHKVPVGVEPAALTHAGAKAAEKAGVDFVVFRVGGTTADALTRFELDYVLRVDGVPSEAELRVLGSLRPLLIIVPRIEAPIPLSRALELRQVAMMSGTPLAAPVSPEIEVESLAALRDSGVALLILEQPTAAEVEALGGRIADMPERPRRGSDDTPTLPGATDADADEDEDEDEDEEYDEDRLRT